MNDVKVFDKKNPSSFGEMNLFANPVVMAETKIGKNYKEGNSSANYDRVFKSPVAKLGGSGTDYSSMAKYGGAIHVPQKWADGRVESAYSRVASGRFGTTPQKAMAAITGNTLLPDWAQLWDAMRIDLTVRKNAIPTVRQMFYKIINAPNASRTNKLIEMYPYGIEFKKNNGTGQPVNMGDKGEGGAGTFDIDIWAAGFTWDLLAELFDKSLDMTMLNDAVAVGYNAIVDDTAMTPILADVYSTAGTAKHTAAATVTNGGRQELLYATIENALDGFGARKDPISGKLIDPSGSVLLVSSAVARHLSRTIGGLPSANQKYYPAINDISAVVAYDGDVIQMRDKTVTYAGVGSTYAYLVKPNRYMNIFVKQGLTAEIDLQPDVKTLAQEERAWWFAEGIYNAEGIASFVQKITLPAW